MGIIISAVLVLISIGLIGWQLDRYTWNKGICRANGIPWEIRDRDSQGGYLIRAGDETTWLNGWITPKQLKGQYVDK